MALRIARPTLRAVHVHNAVARTARVSANAQKRSIHVVVSHVPNSFARALSRSKEPIDVGRAREQHAAYVKALEKNPVVSNVVKLPPAHNMPDSVFVEDTAVMIGRVAAGCRSGAPSRQMEQLRMLEALDERYDVVCTPMIEPATLDGGDVIVTDYAIFIGESKRTNRLGISLLSGQFSVLPLVTVPVSGALHLKSLVTWGGPGVGFFVADTPEGKAAFEAMRSSPFLARAPEDYWRQHLVPDLISANVLRLGDMLYCSDRDEASMTVIDKAAGAAGLTMHSLNYSEFHKADGAITCCVMVAHPEPWAEEVAGLHGDLASDVLRLRRFQFVSPEVMSSFMPEEEEKRLRELADSLDKEWAPLVEQARIFAKSGPPHLPRPLAPEDEQVDSEQALKHDEDSPGNHAAESSNAAGDNSTESTDDVKGSDGDAQQESMEDVGEEPSTATADTDRQEDTDESDSAPATNQSSSESSSKDSRA